MLGAKIDEKEKKFNNLEYFIIIIILIFLSFGVTKSYSYWQRMPYTCLKEESNQKKRYASVMEKWSDSFLLLDSSIAMQAPDRIKDFQHVKDEIQSANWEPCVKPYTDEVISIVNYVNHSLAGDKDLHWVRFDEVEFRIKRLSEASQILFQNATEEERIEATKNFGVPGGSHELAEALVEETKRRAR